MRELQRSGNANFSVARLQVVFFFFTFFCIFQIFYKNKWCFYDKKHLYIWISDLFVTSLPS